MFVLFGNFGPYICFRQAADVADCELGAWLVSKQHDTGKMIEPERYS